jgi:uncharacterized ferredoxin-like protein
MPIYEGEGLASDSLLELARLCIIAALKAPKITNSRVLKTMIISGEDLLPIIQAAEVLAEVREEDIGRGLAFTDGIALKSAYDIDGGKSVVMVLFGDLVTRSELNWNCGACGFSTCTEFNRRSSEIWKKQKDNASPRGPNCVWKFLDFSCAVSWAVACAWQHNVENRLFNSLGRYAKMIGYLEDAASPVILLLGPLTDQWYYNRPAMRKKWTPQEVREFQFRVMPYFFQTFVGTYDPLFRYDALKFGKEPMRLRLEPLAATEPEREERLKIANGKIAEIRAQVLAKRKGKTTPKA